MAEAGRLRRGPNPEWPKVAEHQSEPEQFSFFLFTFLQTKRVFIPNGFLRTKGRGRFRRGREEGGLKGGVKKKKKTKQPGFGSNWFQHYFESSKPKGFGLNSSLIQRELV